MELNTFAAALIAIPVALWPTDPGTGDPWARVTASTQMKATVYWQDQKVAMRPYDRFDKMGFTVAHRDLPLGIWVRVSNPENGHAILAQVNDRGPYANQADIDLSLGSAAALGVRGMGTVHVEIVSIYKSGIPRRIRTFEVLK